MSNTKNPIPQGNYLPATRYGNLVVTAGMTPRKNGVLLEAGKVKASEPIETYRERTVLATENALTAAINTLFDDECIAQILSMTVYINAEPDFLVHAKIGDLASDYLAERLGKAGIGSRACIGMATLPGDASVEVQLFAAIDKK